MLKAFILAVIGFVVLGCATMIPAPELVHLVRLVGIAIIGVACMVIMRPKDKNDKRIK